MQTTTTAFGAALLGVHEVVCTGQIVFNGAPVGDPVDIVDGTITSDRTAARLSRGSIVIGIDSAGSLGLPINSSDINTPYGYEISVTWGLDLGGTIETIPMGVFTIQRTQANALRDQATLTVEDRSRISSDAKLADAYSTASGVDYFTAIEALIADGYPGVTTDFPSTTQTTTRTVLDAQQDRWVEAARMTRSTGNILFHDRTGTLTARPEPSLSDTPATTIATGVQVVAAGLTLDRTQVYNRVVVIGINADLTGNPPRGEASITTGPLAVASGFNERILFYYSEYIANDTQATVVAESILAAREGLIQQIVLEIAADNRLDPYDVVTIEVPELELSGPFIIDKIVYPLGPGPMTITTRAGAAV